MSWYNWIKMIQNQPCQLIDHSLHSYEIFIRITAKALLHKIFCLKEVEAMPNLQLKKKVTVPLYNNVIMNVIDAR